MAKKPNPRDVVSRHQVFLERLKTGYVKDYDNALLEVDKAIVEIIKKLNVERISEVSRVGLKKMMKELQEAQAKIYAKQTEKLFDDLMDLSSSEAAFEKQLITEVALGAGISAGAIKKSKDVWKFLKDKPLQATGDLLEPFIKDLSTRQIARVNREIMVSVSQGRTISQTVQAIRGTKARNFRDGSSGMAS